MADIHCHRCGGFIGNPAGTTYREPSGAAPPVVPHSGMCLCDHSLVYGPKPNQVAGTPRGVHYIRSASRN